MPFKRQKDVLGRGKTQRINPARPHYQEGSPGRCMALRYFSGILKKLREERKEIHVGRGIPGGGKHLHCGRKIDREAGCINTATVVLAASGIKGNGGERNQLFWPRGLPDASGRRRD